MRDLMSKTPMGSRDDPGLALPLSQALHVVAFETRGTGFQNITQTAASWLREVGAIEGLLTLFIRHTSASLIIQENADPDVLADLTSVLEELAPYGRRWQHSIEGPDDMPAHVKSMLTSTSLSIPVTGGRMVLGTWQGIYLIEHRARPHRREVVLQFLGTRAPAD